MSQTGEDKCFVELAIEICQAQYPGGIESLKEFLCGLQSPRRVRHILTVAVRRLAEHAPDTCRWLIRHRSHLEPELNLVTLARDLALAKLREQGFVADQDFTLDANGQLFVSEQARAAILTASSGGDRLLLEELLSSL